MELRFGTSTLGKRRLEQYSAAILVQIPRSSLHFHPSFSGGYQYHSANKKRPRHLLRLFHSNRKATLDAKQSSTN